MERELGTRFRSRITPQPNGSGSVFGKRFIETFRNSNVWVLLDTIHGTDGRPYITAESCWDDIHPGPPYRSGGPFRKIKLEYANEAYNATLISTHDQVFTPFGNGRHKWVGGVSPPSNWPYQSEFIDLKYSLGMDSPFVADTSSLDQPAWNNTKPRIEQGGLFVALAEVRDVPRMLKTTSKGFHDIWKTISGSSSTSALMSPKKAADHFLNHNFGWVPFLKDLGSFIDNINHSRERIGRLKNENGQWIRRRSVLVDSTESGLVPGWSGSGIWGIYPFNTAIANDTWIGTPTWKFFATYETHATAVGKFRYYLPYFDINSPEWDGLGAIRRQLALHGARISPSNVYKAVPWTWLADWITPLGHDIQMIQDEWLDNVAAQYLYLSHHQVTRLRFEQYIPLNSDSGGARTFTWSRLIDVKQRRQASPFGFNLSWSNFSPKQWAILAALGISRKG